MIAKIDEKTGKPQPHSRVSSREIRRAAGKKKKADRQGGMQRGVGMGWTEGKDSEQRTNETDRRKSLRPKVASRRDDGNTIHDDKK